MTTETPVRRKARIAMHITKLVVLHSVSATVGYAVYQNVNVTSKLAKVQLAVGSYALGSAAAEAGWKAVERDLDEIVNAFRNAKQTKEDEVIVITDVE